MPSIDWLLQLPLDLATLGFAAIVGLLMPISATRTKRRLDASASPPQAFRKGAAGGQLLLLALSAYVAVTHGVAVWTLPASAARWLYAVPALAAIEALRWIAWHSYSLEDKRTLWVRTILPSRADLPAWTALTCLAAVTEEIAYRALLFAVVATASHSVAVGALGSAVAFGAAHAPQGRRSQLLIGGIALVFQALVIVTGSLLPAIAVHGAANMIAAIRGPKRFREVDALSGGAQA